MKIQLRSETKRAALYVSCHETSGEYIRKVLCMFFGLCSAVIDYIYSLSFIIKILRKYILSNGDFGNFFEQEHGNRQQDGGGTTW